MQIVNLYPGSFGSNCYLLESDGHAFIVDPSAAASAILRRLKADGCVPDGIILTHGHFDHIMSIDTLREAVPSLKVYIHEEDMSMLTDADKNAFGTFFGKDRVWHAADATLSDGQVLPVGNTLLRVLHTPGHSAGSICLLSEQDGILLTGDTLFADSIGRHDLWGSSYNALHASIQSLHELDRNLTIYPGHGDTERLSTALANAAYFFRPFSLH